MNPNNHLTTLRGKAIRIVERGLDSGELDDLPEDLFGEAFDEIWRAVYEVLCRFYTRAEAQPEGD